MSSTANPGSPPMLNKVPEVTAIFWIIKILSTTVGETGADYLAVHVGLGATTTAAVMAYLLAVALVLQLRARSYVPWIYWLTVVLISVVGTQMTDLLTDRLEISLYISTVAFAAALAGTFAIWYGIERTLSIQTIITTRRELFYWAAILFTFALGTATGDLATEALGLGFQLGVVVFSLLIAVVAISGSDVLARLHPDAAARRLARRFAVTVAHLWRRGSRHDLHQHRVSDRHHRARRLGEFRRRPRAKGGRGAMISAQLPTEART